MQNLSTESLINIITILKEGLKFYRNTANYDIIDGKSVVSMDKGNYADLTIKRTEEIVKYFSNMEKVIEDLNIENVDENFSEEKMNEILNKINEIYGDGE